MSTEDRTGMRIFKKNKAFTLIELIVVVIVIGVLTGLAIPRFTNTVEKSRIAEAINILETLRNAQEVYKLENSGYAAVLDDLDVTISPPRNFLMPIVASGNPIASIERNAGGYQYTLTINSDGTLRCRGIVNPAGICAILGCPGGTCN